METIPTPEDANELKQAVVEAFLKNSPEAKKLYSEWCELRENEVDSETDPTSRRVKQIEFNIERADILTEINDPDGAYESYLDVLEQINNELEIPADNPERIETAVLVRLKTEIEKKLNSL